MATEQPKECPFCGGGVKVWRDAVTTAWRLRCCADNCFAKPGVVGLTRSEMLRRWNARAPTAAITAAYKRGT